MNKSEFVAAVAKEAGMTKVDAKKALESALITIQKTLKKGEKISFVGFGSFYVTKRKARTGVNPSTKKPIKIAAKKVAKFRPGAELSKAVAK